MSRFDPHGERRWPSQHVHEHRCTECGTTFPAVATHAELCSNRCVQRRRRRLLTNPDVPPMVEYAPRDCTECGAEFEPVTSRTKVCSNPCKQRAIRRRKREQANDRVLVA